MKLYSENAPADGDVSGTDGAPMSGEIAGLLARELRGPLSTIEGYLELLANGGVGAITEEQREFFDVISRNVHRLTVVVSDWIDVTRLEAGQIELKQVPVDLEEVVDRAVAALKPRIRSKVQQVSVEAPSELVEAIGDQRALQRVVDNLLSNAQKYTPPGGSIRLVLTIQDEQTVRLDVIDTGIGIREEDQARLFRKFFRAHLTESEPGSGLGLALARELLDRMDGQISVQSALGQGSTFSIALPRAVPLGAAATTDLVGTVSVQIGQRFGQD
jgi:signal transduction histidine kinase